MKAPPCVMEPASWSRELPVAPTLTKTVRLDEIVDLRSLPPHRYLPSHPFVQNLRKAVPFDFFSVTGLDFDGYRFGAGHSIDTDAPPAFLDVYYGEALFKTDPMVQAALHAQTVIIEEEVYRQSPPSPRLQQLSQMFGVHNRTLFPVRRGNVMFGAVTFARKVPFTREEIDFLKDIADVMHRVLTGPIMEKFATQSLKLSEGEIACLRLASDGKTTEQIAGASGYTPDTVNSYIKSAIKKLGADNRVHAIAEAIRRGLIP